MKSLNKVTIAIIVLVVIVGVRSQLNKEPIMQNEIPVQQPIVQPVEEPEEPVEEPVDQPLPEEETVALSDDSKDILVDGEVVLSIEDDAIFNWFSSESQLCDESNRTSTPDREMFCENAAFFRESSQFSAIAYSSDMMEIGFTIESDTLSPDTVAGVFSRATNNVDMLTNYYLGNEFLSFSPSGNHFVYKGECWEGMCGLFVKESQTLVDTLSINNPETLDMRQWDATFIQWISDSEIEYELQSSNGEEVRVESSSF